MTGELTTTGTRLQTGAQSSVATGTERRQGRVEQVIDGLVDLTIVPLSNAVVSVASSGLLLAVFAVLWIAFGAALIWSQGSLDAAWAWIHSLPLIAQGAAWLLFLPVVAGLWIWETTWPLVVRVALVAGLAGWNILVFLPRAAQQ
jgi:hypothetical protein